MHDAGPAACIPATTIGNRQNNRPRRQLACRHPHLHAKDNIMSLDYETLKVIWWAFVGVLIIGFALTDGFDFGVGMMLPFVGKSDGERRVIINTIGPVWEGNQTWFITAGGATFAAWPLVYATAFSGFYIALMILLFSLFFRPVGFDYRSKVADPRWRNAWDWGSADRPPCYGSQSRPDGRTARTARSSRRCKSPRRPLHRPAAKPRR